MAALEFIVQKYIEERGHFIVNFRISRFRLAEKHLHKLRSHITGNNFAVLPVIVLQTAIKAGQREVRVNKPVFLFGLLQNKADHAGKEKL